MFITGLNTDPNLPPGAAADDVQDTLKWFVSIKMKIRRKISLF
jgi:hypothetical protein